MIRTNEVEFESKRHREDVTDAVTGRAQALTEETEKLRAMFAAGQTLKYVDINERTPVTEISFVFEDRAEYEMTVEVLVGQSDDDLDWLGRELRRVGIDEADE